MLKIWVFILRVTRSLEKFQIGSDTISFLFGGDISRYPVHICRCLFDGQMGLYMKCVIKSERKTSGRQKHKFLPKSSNNIEKKTSQILH